MKIQFNFAGFTLGIFIRRQRRPQECVGSAETVTYSELAAAIRSAAGTPAMKTILQSLRFNLQCMQRELMTIPANELECARGRCRQLDDLLFLLSEEGAATLMENDPEKISGKFII